MAKLSKELIEIIDLSFTSYCNFNEENFDDFGEITSVKRLRFNILPKDELIGPIGILKSKLNNFFLIQSNARNKILNEGSILLLKNKAKIGIVLDIVGPIKAPLYLSRFYSGKKFIEIGCQFFTIKRFVDFI